MRRYHSLLEKPPRPHYEKNFGHELENIIVDFVNDQLPGVECIHASETEDLSNGKDIIVLVPGTEIKKSFQVTMTGNPEVLERKKKRGIPVIAVPPAEVEKAWRRFEQAKQENPDLTFSYQFLPDSAKKKIIGSLIQDPTIHRHITRALEGNNSDTTA